MIIPIIAIITVITIEQWTNARWASVGPDTVKLLDRSTELKLKRLPCINTCGPIIIAMAPIGAQGIATYCSS